MIEVRGRSRNRKVIEGNLRKKEKKKEGGKEKEQSQEKAFSSYCHMAQKETNL